MDINQFLEQIKNGYSKFKIAFDEITIEDVSDFDHLDKDLNDSLLISLKNFDAKPLHIKRIFNAINNLSISPKETLSKTINRNIYNSKVSCTESLDDSIINNKISAISNSVTQETITKINLIKHIEKSNHTIKDDKLKTHSGNEYEIEEEEEEDEENEEEEEDEEEEEEDEEENSQVDINEWSNLKCNYCNVTENLEFATDDGTEIKSIILCLVCSKHPKIYSQRYGDLYEFFCDPECLYCGTGNDLLIKIGSCSTQDVYCRQCILENKYD